MAYSHVNSKGQTYHLHSRDVGTKGSKLYFFSKKPEDSIDLPDNMQVIEGPTGLPMVKKKA
ncbi:MAG: hypothetical protein HY833_00485 [Candidatus Aenigmarchaeota archaeon]|nr:hypothetical protein [Candidatus Aenigmarchaeota archaeon]